MGRRVTPLPASVFADEPAPDDDAARAGTARASTSGDGTYGDYLTGKVARVFPALFATVVD